jgi:hypothetical protein
MPTYAAPIDGYMMLVAVWFDALQRIQGSLRQTYYLELSDSVWLLETNSERFHTVPCWCSITPILFVRLG